MARDFDGATDRIDYANIQDISGQAQSLSLWIYPEDDANSQYFLIVHVAGDAAFSVIFWLGATNALRFSQLTDGDDLFVDVDDGLIISNTWQNIIYTWDGSQTAANVHIYVNGSEVTYDIQTNGTGNNNTAGGSWSLGGRITDDTRNFDGRLASPGWWNRILEAREIAGLAEGYVPQCYQNGLQFAPPLIRHQRDPVSGKVGTLDGTTAIAHPRIIEEGSTRGVWAIPAGAALFASIADTVGISDTIVTEVGVIRSIADNVGISDTLSKIGTYIRALADNLAITDTINTARNLVIAQAESVGVTDTIVTSKGAVRNIADTVGITDTIATIKRAVRGIADTVGVTDVLSKVGTFIKSIADSIGITDTLNTEKFVLVSLADTVGITDTLSKIGTYIRSVVDGVGITDVLSKIGTYKRSVADTEGITDTVATSKGVFRSIADSVGIADVVSAVVGKVAAIADSIGITDTITTIVTAVITPFVDTISGLSRIVKSISTDSGMTKSQSKKSEINKNITGDSEL